MPVVEITPSSNSSRASLGHAGRSAPMEKVAVDHATLHEIIVKAAIYPSIGIARVGNSLTEWYVGPEVPDPLPLPPGSYRDSGGALKREAARFRVYGLNAAGTVVRE